MNIYYLSSENKKICLSEWPYYIQSENLFDYKWHYSYRENGSGGNVSRFYKGMTEIPIAVAVRSDTQEEYINALNAMFEVFERDVMLKTPGRLYVGDSQYMSCYMMSSAKSGFSMDIRYTLCSITVLTERPFWRSETQYNFQIAGVTSTKNRRYSGKYPNRYANGLTHLTAHNPDFVSSAFMIRIYGPAVSPEIILSDNPYQVHTTLLDGEYLTINSSARTILKTKNEGETINEFDLREKEHNIFAPICPGTISVNWSGSFAFDLIFYADRSEPKWIL